MHYTNKHFCINIRKGQSTQITRNASIYSVLSVNARPIVTVVTDHRIYHNSLVILTDDFLVKLHASSLDQKNYKCQSKSDIRLFLFDFSFQCPPLHLSFDT